MRGRRRKPDYWTIKAKKEGLQSRAAYKLIQIHQRFRIFRPGDVVLDLCGAPGGFSKVARQHVGPRGRIILVDLQRVRLKNVHCLQLDITAENFLEILKEQLKEKEGVDILPPPITVVLSDCAPKVTGNWSLDHARQMYLSEQALQVARQIKPRVFLCKLFQGEEFPEFLKKVETFFSSVKLHKPPTSRKRSAEIYLIAKNPRTLEWDAKVGVVNREEVIRPAWLAVLRLTTFSAFVVARSAVVPIDDCTMDI